MTGILFNPFDVPVNIPFILVDIGLNVLRAGWLKVPDPKCSPPPDEERRCF